jgi:aspartyl-tRNA(Asn)/glutamyl-tRNA(Gln) amidotransferase subunit C
MATKFTTDDVAHIAKLARIPVTEEEKIKLASGFNTVIGVLDVLKKVDVTNVEPTHQVTGLENVTREDVVDEKRMFTQEEALVNAPKKHDGYFVVDQVIDHDGV